MFQPKDVRGCRETDPSHATAMRRLLVVTLCVLSSAEPGTAQGCSWQWGLPRAMWGWGDLGIWGCGDVEIASSSENPASMCAAPFPSPMAAAKARTQILTLFNFVEQTAQAPPR